MIVMINQTDINTFYTTYFLEVSLHPYSVLTVEDCKLFKTLWHMIATQYKVKHFYLVWAFQNFFSKIGIGYRKISKSYAYWALD